MKLQDSGNTVIVNRTGNQPLSQCTVAGVRAGHTYSRFDSGYPGAQMDPDEPRDRHDGVRRHHLLRIVAIEPGPARGRASGVQSMYSKQLRPFLLIAVHTVECRLRDAFCLPAQFRHLFRHDLYVTQ